MIRRLNYTGRRRIKRKLVTIRLRREEAGTPSFDADLDLAGMDLPREAAVFVEAYHGSSYMRFDFGTVGRLVTPDDRRLTDIAANCRPRFRVKVVDCEETFGRILAVADQLLPLREDEDAAARGNLLPVEYVDLGDQVWRLDLTDAPTLELNSRIEGLRDIARGDSHFFALVYPEAVRRILRRVILVEEMLDPEYDPDDWRCQWLTFACRLPGVQTSPPDGDTDAQQDWIEAAVAAFCSAKDARRRFETAIGEDEG